MMPKCEHPKCQNPAALRIAQLGAGKSRVACWEHAASVVDEFRREWFEGEED